MPSTGPILLGEQLRFSSTSGGLVEGQPFLAEARERSVEEKTLYLFRMKAQEHALCTYALLYDI